MTNHSNCPAPEAARINTSTDAPATAEPRFEHPRRCRRFVHVLATSLLLGVFSHSSAVDAQPAATSTAANSNAQAPVEITVDVRQLRNSNGKVLALLFSGAEGFPSDRTKAVRIARTKIRGGKASFRFDKLPPGQYALALVHDEDGNDHVTTNFLGLPKEGLGVSDGRKNIIAYPRYKTAKFSAKPGKNSIPVFMRYL